MSHQHSTAFQAFISHKQRDEIRYGLTNYHKVEGVSFNTSSPVKVSIIPPLFLCQQRPYQDDSTASRLLSEVKHLRAQLVLRWGTTLEY